MMDLDLERILTGENLIFYQNIEDLKVLTSNARALITRSHAVFNDILQNHLFSRPVRATEQQEEVHHSLTSLHGDCVKCGLQHGAHGFCIVHELMKAEQNKTEGPRKSATALSQSLDLHEEDEECSFAQPPEKSRKEKVKEWRNLLYRKMTQKELDNEYSRICHMYGVANGRKFLLARSLAQEPDKVKPLFTSENQPVTRRNTNKSRIVSITRDCLTEKKLDLPDPCPDISPYIRSKMASVLDWTHPCEFKMPKEEKVWKNSLKTKPKSETIYKRETTEDLVSLSLSNADLSSASRVDWCHCGLDECECGIQPTCNPPEKRCLTATGYQNNYLLTIREKLRKRRLQQDKALLGAHQSMALSSGELPSKVSLDVFQKDSEMMEKAYTLHQKELKNCIESKIGVNDANLDQNVSNIAELTSAFTKPDDKAWDEWTAPIRGVKDKLDDADDDGVISGDSDIPTSCSNSITSSSTTDLEIQHPQPTTRHIPFVEEPLRMVDILFDKIYTRFRKLTEESLSSNMTHPAYKRFFFSHVANLISLPCTDSIGGELVNKLSLYIPRLKTLRPKIQLKAHRLKRLERKKKNLSKTIRRRNYIEGIQLGKRYRRTKKPSKFSKDQGYIGFKAKDRKLFEMQTPQRFAACDLVGDGCDVLLSRERIHYHYRLLKTLFNGSMQSEDKESLMDEGMMERLQQFKKTLKNRPHSQFETDSDTEGDDDVVRANSITTRRPLKRNEKKLKSAPEQFPGGTRSCQDSQRLSIRLNQSKLFNEMYSRTDKTSSYRTSKGIPTLSKSDQPVTTRALPSSGSSLNSFNRWDGYTIAPSLLEESLPRASKNSSRKLSSKQMNYPTRSDQTEVPTRTLYNQSNMSEESSNTLSLNQMEPFHLPTPPLSESSCGELDSDFIQHRVPPKEEAHMEKSARIDVTAREKQTENILNPKLRVHDKYNSQRVEESELTDKSSDSYVPKLLKIPPKRPSARPDSLISYAHRGAVGHKTFRSRASFPYLSDSSSTDTEPTNPVRQNQRERRAWDHESGLNRIAPHLDTQPRATNNVNLPSSGQRKANYESWRTRNEKSAFTSPLPKAGPSILKKSSLPKPPSDGTSETQSKTHGLDGTTPVKRQSFSDSSYRTTSWQPEGLVRPARVVTERLLKATQVNPNVDLTAGSTRKYSGQSRATPDAIPSSSIGPSTSRKTSVPLLGVPKSGQPVGLRRSPSPDVVTGRVSAADSNQVRIDIPSAASSKRFSKSANYNIASEVFRRRSLVTPTDQIEKHEPQLKNKPGKKAAEETLVPTLPDPSVTSNMGAKLKKLEAIGPTKRKCFDTDIGQGINCVNYLKENAPGADEIKKIALVDLLITPVLEVKKSPKKANVENENSIMDGAIVPSKELSALESKSTSLAGIDSPSSQHKAHAHALSVQQSPLRKDNFKTLDQIYKEVHGINKNNTPKNLVENDYEYESKKRQQLKKHKIFP